jgi:hypothetical protein
MDIPKTLLPWKAAYIVLCLAPILVSGQPPLSIPDIEPAETAVPLVLTAGALLQRTKILELTDQDVARLFADDSTAEIVNFFSVENETSQRASTPACQTFPDDSV